MSYMFYNASNFNQYIGGWDVNNVSNYNNFSTNSGLLTINLPIFQVNNIS